MSDPPGLRRGATRPEPERSPITVRVLRSRPEIEAIADAWDALVDPRRSFRAFATSSVYLAWCQLRPEPLATPWVFTAWRGGSLVGVLPLWRTDDEPRLQFPGNLSDTNEVLVAGPPGPEAETVARTLLDTALEEGPLLLRCVPEDSLLRRVVSPQRLQRVGKVQCPYIDLREGFEAYLATRTTKFRTRLRRFLRKADDHGLWVGELRPDRLSPEALPRLFLDLHLERIPSSSLTEPENQRHIELTMPRLFEQGAYRVFAVLRPQAPRNGGVEPVDVLALGICVETPRGLGLWNGGFRNEATEVSPGRLLIHAELQAAIAEGAQEFDFLRGGERYKEDWCTGRRWLGHWVVG